MPKAEVKMTRREYAQLQHKRRSNLIKIIALFILLASIMLVLLFWEAAVSGVVPIFDMTGQRQFPQTTFAEGVHNDIVTQGQEDAVGAGKADLSNAYVDAKGVVAEYRNELVSTTSGGLTVGNGTPTKELTSCAYVINIKQLLVAEYEDINWIEQQLGLTVTADPSECADTFLNKTGSKFNFVMGESWYTRFSGFGGAVGPAILRRDFYTSGDSWLASNVTTATYAYAAFSGDKHVDLMLVKQSDYDAYYAGTNPPITYVRYNVVDLKAHSAPWGVGQTYLYFGPNNTITSWKSSGGSGYHAEYPQAQRQHDGKQSVLEVYKALKSTGSTQYWVATMNATGGNPYGFPVGYWGGNAYNVSTSCIFETGTNQAYQDYKNAYKDYALVGILVYADKDTR